MVSLNCALRETDDDMRVASYLLWPTSLVFLAGCSDDLSPGPEPRLAKSWQVGQGGAYDIDSDANGNVYVSSYGQVIKYTADGEKLLTVFTSGYAKLAVGPGGPIYVASGSDSTLRTFSPEGIPLLTNYLGDFCALCRMCGLPGTSLGVQLLGATS